MGKLTVQIVSNNPVAAQALQNFLGTCKTLPEFYQFHVTALPSEPEQAASTSSDFHQMVDCDVLCLVVELKQMLSSNEQWFIEQGSNTHSVKRFVVVEIPEIDSQSEQLIQADIAGIEAWIRSHSSEPSIEIISLFLRPFYPNAQSIAIDSNYQRKLEQFCKSLETLVRRKPEDILSKRIAAQILFQLVQLERAFDMEAEILKQEIRQVEGKLHSIKQSDSTDELKEQAEQALKQVNEDKEFFLSRLN